MATRSPLPTRALCLLLMPAALALSGGCQPSGPEITVRWARPKTIAEQTPVKYGVQEGGTNVLVEIGQVAGVLEKADGTAYRVELSPRYAHYVTTNTVFLYESEAEGRAAFVEALPLDPDAPPVSAGATLKGVESRAEVAVRRLVKDWPRTLIIAGVGILLLLALFAIGKLMLRNWAILLCIAAGAACTIYLTPFVLDFLAPLLPPNIRADVVAYVSTFVAGYLLAMLVLGVLRHPLHAAKVRR